MTMHACGDTHDASAPAPAEALVLAMCRFENAEDGLHRVPREERLSSSDDREGDVASVEE